ncbi:MAG: type II toxin-antitoxin system HicB family antitoxin [Chroococcidiopsidaceae cyanobacterium CP_BM_RX_35]|nr:type II toxin-antitoxin system HicB family antitoxin [Chroococcidiopsidaceae cyanobacterium CP_BM_RX_35]
MLSDYINAAMHRAIYEPIGDGTVFAEIPGFDGLWANAQTRAECVDELRSVLEGWIVLGLRLGHTLPIVDGLDLTPPLVPIEEDLEVA